MLLYGAWEDRKYAEALHDEIRRLDPAARRPMAIDREITVARQRAQMLDSFRKRTQADLDALNEVTHLLPPPGLVISMELTRDQIRLNGEAEQAAGLLRVLDKSPLFEASDFALPMAQHDNRRELQHSCAAGRDPAMTITQRDRRALMLAVPAIAVILIYAATSPKQTVVVAPRGSNESVASMTQRLAGMRQSVARVPGKEALLKQVSAELTEREKNLIVADTAAQATEQLLQIVRTIARAQGPAVELEKR